MNQIYKITNTINNKVYIGQTIRPLKERFGEHCRPSSECFKLRNAIQKHGRDSFTIELIGICHNQEDADNMESFFIENLRAIKDGYNIDRGGDGTGPRSKETRQKISRTRLARNIRISERHKQQVSAANKGKTWSVIDGKRVWK